MKQQIVKISNIKFKDIVKTDSIKFKSINKLKDATQTFAYDYLSQYTDMNEHDKILKSHESFVRATLFNYYDIDYDIEYISADDDEYQEAANIIESYDEQIYIVDDVDNDNEQLHDETYSFDYSRTVYMYYDDVIEHALYAFCSSKETKRIFRQMIYEYLVRYLKIEINNL